MVFVLAILCAACSQDSGSMKEGYYTAEAKNFDATGWKDYVTIYVSNNKIVTVDYNAKNSSGFLQSWDVEYMRSMNAETGTYPNKYIRFYAADLLNKQDPSAIHAMPGSELSCASFRKLAEAAIARAKAGNKKVAFIDLSPGVGENKVLEPVVSDGPQK